MVWNSWNDFFAMGGYALYVWGSVLAVAAGIAVEVASVRFRLKAIRSRPDSAKHSDRSPGHTGERT